MDEKGKQEEIEELLSDISLVRLSRLEYPGRFIILGRSPDDKSNVAIYGITGRSPPSRARRLVLEENQIKVEPTDPEVLKKGNPDLLIYPAMIFDNFGIVVSNGVQTRELAIGKDVSLSAALSSAHSKYSYESDEPNFTPRISGIIRANSDYIVLGNIKKIKDSLMPKRNQFELPLIPGRGYLLSTYNGVNTNPLKSFSGEPLEVKLIYNTPEAMANEAYEAITPGPGKDDLRVAVAAASQDKIGNWPKTFIINRVDRKE